MAPIKKIKPDIITLGFDQKIDEVILKKKLLSLNLNPKIIRIDNIKKELYSTHLIIQKIIHERVLKTI